MEFGIDANWLLTGQSVPQKKQSSDGEDEKMDRIEKENQELRADLLDTLRENRRLREENEQLKRGKIEMNQDTPLSTP